ncbi:histone lysine acetyltransferase CREBBP-like isoform X2 [Planococcus citri]|uniref:histone lysine acetyltransferase CREBBP-like isoform X2 n=1 Tax=Planococcus citri TaxID=170843 RepID=UPI0031F8A51E
MKPQEIEKLQDSTSSSDVLKHDSDTEPASTSQSVQNTSSSTEKEEKCILKPEDQLRAFLPVLQNLYQLEESMPFQEPVDPIKMGLPNYFTIIKEPIDLSIIKRKLDDGQYIDPWDFVNDMWLMFDNASLYFKKSSAVYKCCTKLVEIFGKKIDQVMRNMGYCCGRKYTCSPRTRRCSGNHGEIIQKDTDYFSYQNEYTFCAKCFDEIPGDTVTVGEDAFQHRTFIKKNQFVKATNSVPEMEPFVECLDCGRRSHQICVMYMDQMWYSRFVCKNCNKIKKVNKKESKLRARMLPITTLGTHMETRVNQFLKKKNAGAGKVTVRVVSSCEKTVVVKPAMKSRFVDTGALPEQFPYKAKTLLAFQEIDGVDVCIFGMHVQECGSECPPPNQRRVYIAYFDYVQLFQPECFRIAVYQEILLGYLDYVKKLGYMVAHIRAFTPPEEENFMFHCRPDDQKNFSQKRLTELYRKMLDKGIVEKVIDEYNDILKQAMEDQIQSVTGLPYFEDDLWPNVLEESINELKQEEEEKRQQAGAAKTASNAVDEQLGYDVCIDDNGNKIMNLNYLMAKIYKAMVKYQHNFFVIRLHSAETAANLPPIADPDQLIACDLMDGGDAFLTMAREKGYEFSSLRRAKFSTMALVYELLYTRIPIDYFYICNKCKKVVEMRFHCVRCKDYDLCISCFDKEGHPHKMNKVYLGLDLENDTLSTLEVSAYPLEVRKQSMQVCIDSLTHACQCRVASCPLLSCQRMKRVILHSRTKQCKLEGKVSCPICRHLTIVVYHHAKDCRDTECAVPECSSIRKEMNQILLQQSVERAKLLLRHVAEMKSSISSSTESSSQSNSETSSPGSSGQNSSQTPTKKSVRVLLSTAQVLHLPSHPQLQQDKVLQELKANPQLTVAFVKERREEQQQSGDRTKQLPALQSSVADGPIPMEVDVVAPSVTGVLKPEVQKRAFLPLLQYLFQQHESLPFREPVDPVELGVPNYFDVIKNPMDLSTIISKLNDGLYGDPWDFVNDVWLMFDNAWLFNLKSSCVYKCCTLLAELFRYEITPIMQSLGYCCGRKYTFSPEKLTCFGKQLCQIPREAQYFNYQNKYTYCVNCFKEIPGDEVAVADDLSQSPTVIKKDQFVEMCNGCRETESFVECLECGIKLHRICILHVDQIWPSEFVCDNCLKKNNMKRKENEFRAKALPITELSTYIEARVNKLLEDRELGISKVTVRVISSSQKTMKVKPYMKSRFVDTGKLPEQFPYTAKVLFAFQEIDGVDVCVFGMHVQEYGSECPQPNQRRVYIAYFDYVHFFEPETYRTDVYQEILLSYLDYVKKLGYTMAHMWVCSPPKGEDFIFNHHPHNQKVPSHRQLMIGCRDLLGKAGYKDILKRAMEDKLQSAAELPYFEGDFWPIILEEIIKDLDQLKEEKKVQTDAKDLIAIIYAIMEKVKDGFLAIQLHSTRTAATLPIIEDPDPLIACDLMDGRDAILTLARNRHYEFSTLRRAKFSSMAMLYEIHIIQNMQNYKRCGNAEGQFQRAAFPSHFRVF